MFVSSGFIFVQEVPMLKDSDSGYLGSRSFRQRRKYKRLARRRVHTIRVLIPYDCGGQEPEAILVPQP